MKTFKSILGFAGVLALYGFTDWLGGVAAPVLGPTIMVALLVSLFWALYRLSKVGK